MNEIDEGLEYAQRLLVGRCLKCNSPDMVPSKHHCYNCIAGIEVERFIDADFDPKLEILEFWKTDAVLYRLISSYVSREINRLKDIIPPEDYEKHFPSAANLDWLDTQPSHLMPGGNNLIARLFHLNELQQYMVTGLAFVPGY